MAVKTEKEARKLGIEELERRAAPMAIVDVDQPEPTEPTGGEEDPSLPAGGGDGSPIVEQPGKSGPHRQNRWHESQ